MKLFLAWLLRWETVKLAQLAKDIETELARRAEYAVKFGVHAPRQNFNPGEDSG